MLGAVGFHARRDIRLGVVKRANNGKGAGVRPGSMDIIVIAKAVIALV